MEMNTRFYRVIGMMIAGILMAVSFAKEVWESNSVVIPLLKTILLIVIPLLMLLNERLLQFYYEKWALQKNYYLYILFAILFSAGYIGACYYVIQLKNTVASVPQQKVEKETRE